MPNPHINPNTSDLAVALATRICEVIATDDDLYALPENAAVIPEALLSVLASTIATQFQRRGHAELIRLSAEKLTDLVDGAYALRQFFAAAEDAGAVVSTPVSKLRKAPDAAVIQELAALDRADALAANPPPDLEAELARLMDGFFSSGKSQH